MGYHLENKYNNSFTCNNWGFQRILELAIACGWEPDGTSLDGDDSWDCNDYESQNGQMVSQLDAKEIYRVLSNLLVTHKSIEGKRITIEEDEIDLVKEFLDFIKPEGTKNACSFSIQ
jgi:hypothetical protein